MGCPTRRVGRVGPAALPRSAACGTSPFVEQPQPQLCLPSNHFHPELASVVVAGERMTQYSGCAPPMCSSVPSSISPSYIDLILRLGCNAVDHPDGNDFTPSHHCPPKLYVPILDMQIGFLHARVPMRLCGLSLLFLRQPSHLFFFYVRCHSLNATDHR